MSEPETHGTEHREGLSHDLPAMQDKGMVQRSWGRRRLLGLGAGLGAGLGVALVAGCGSDSGKSSGAAATASDRPRPPGGMPPGGAGSVDQASLDDGDIPEETNGPYPADGTNGLNILTASGIVRSDITRSFGDADGVAEGVPTTLRLRLYDNNADGMTPYAGAAVYIWHCDRDGNYSLYSSGLEEENYLRGVQVADDDGRLEFTTIFPACYSGRWPHIHFEVYPDVDKATTAAGKLRTSQIALPEDVCSDVYGSAEGYEQSVTNLEQLSLDSDNVFSDGHSLQLAKVSGSVEEGYTVSLNVPV